MKTVTTVQENAGDVLAEAKQINEDRAAEEAEAEVKKPDSGQWGRSRRRRRPFDGVLFSEKARSVSAEWRKMNFKIKHKIPGRIRCIWGSPE